MTEKLIPLTHPGKFLEEDYLEPLGLSRRALARAIGVSAPRINDLVRGRRGVTADTALRLATYFGTSPELWLNLQVRYDLETARRAVASDELEAIEPLVASV